MTRHVFVGLTSLIRIGFLGVALHQGLHSDWTGVFVAFQAFLISFLPNILKRCFDVHTPFALRVGVVFFMFATLILGEMADFYNMFWWWDLVLHGVASIGITLIGFITLFIFFKHIDLRASALFATLLAIGLSLSAAVIWELYEFVIDLLFTTDTPMQPSNTDTMMDLAIATVCALLVGVSGYRYIRWRSRGVIEQVIHDGAKRNANSF